MPTGQPDEKSDNASQAAREASSSPPDIPDHELLRCIGRGTYGEVWLAKNVMETFRAVKIVRRGQFQDRTRFEREFAGTRKFEPVSRSHPGFVQVLHIGRNERAGYFYSIMELADDLISGQKIDPNTYSPRNLARELLNRGRLPLAECVGVGIVLSAALQYLHQQQLVHRDIKPSNVIYVNGVPKFADIGLVTEIDWDGPDVTYIGTTGYIPPEGSGSPTADIYSLSKVLYSASTGVAVHNFPELPSDLVDREDREELLRLNRILAKGGEEDSHRRYQSAAQLHEDLQVLLRGFEGTLKRASQINQSILRLIEVGRSPAPDVVVTTSEQKVPTIPDHSLIRFIAEGGCGKVWLAKNMFGTFRAVKIVYRSNFKNSRPFDRELEGVRTFEPHSRAHDGFVDVLHVGKDDRLQCFYYVMELADDQSTGQQIDIGLYEAKTLRSELDQRKKLPFEESLRLSLWLTSALGYLHKLRIIHRDIKPSNIVYIGGVPKLADVGLVAELRTDISTPGTPKYMPPELRWSPPGDVYSLGLVLFEASTGKDPKDFPSSLEDFLRDEKEEIRHGLAGVIFHACEREPGKRYQSAEEMHEALQLLQPVAADSVCRDL